MTWSHKSPEPQNIAVTVSVGVGALIWRCCRQRWYFYLQWNQRWRTAVGAAVGAAVDAAVDGFGVGWPAQLSR